MIKETCPGGRRLQALLEEGEAGDDADELAHHLESCPACQETLQELAAPPTDWVCTARGLMDEARAEPALHRLVRQLKEEDPLPAEDRCLSFLRPADKPGVLGLLDRYEVQEEIGRGGMGVVLKALDPNLSRVVAIKVLSPWLAGNATARRRFVREAKAAAAVCHDHIVTVHGVSEAGGLPYLVMQYIAGESLQARLDREGPLPAAEIVRIGLQTASGLAAAHAQGLIHRDIKPANLLLEKDTARVKITDFGLARMTDDVGLTQNGVVAGTPEYMAPEQARGEVVDHRADLFSLGSVLYACCTGSPPFRGATVLAVLSRVNAEEPAPLRSRNADVPAWLEALIARLMVKDPAQRFQIAAEVVTLLEGYLAHLCQPASVPVPELPSSCLLGSLESSFPKSRMAKVKRFLPYLWLPVLLGLAVWGLSLFPLAQVVPPEQPPPKREPALRQFYQDFRGGQALHPALIMWGADAEELSKPEAEGLRITLPATRTENNFPVGVATTFALSGDFEVTGTYEWLSAPRPHDGYGVGVGLNIADTDARSKFANASRKMLIKQGNVFKSEIWAPWGMKMKPTTSRIGQLRVTRKGSDISCLVADGLEGNFQELFSKPQFGTEDMAHVHFEVWDGGKPGNAIDVRLIDLNIRAANFIPDPGDTDLLPAPASAPTPGREAERKPGSRKWLAALAIMGLLVLSTFGVFLVVRRLRRPGDSPSSDLAPEGEVPARTAAPPISLRCSSCEKTLKVKSALAGKKVKCPKCGMVLAVPAPS